MSTIHDFLPWDRLSNSEAHRPGLKALRTQTDLFSLHCSSRAFVTAASLTYMASTLCENLAESLSKDSVLVSREKTAVVIWCGEFRGAPGVEILGSFVSMTQSQVIHKGLVKGVPLCPWLSGHDVSS